MRTYKWITYWENLRRVNQLSDFRQFVVGYSNNTNFSPQDPRLWAPEYIENPAALVKRSQINLILEDVYEIVIAAGLNPIILIDRIGEVDIIHELFSHHENPNTAPEIIRQSIGLAERTIGVYLNDKSFSMWRTPFVLIGYFVEFILTLPFIVIVWLLGALGLDRARIESSKVGKLLKFLSASIVTLAAFLTILDKLGRLDSFKLMIGIH